MRYTYATGNSVRYYKCGTMLEMCYDIENGMRYNILGTRYDIEKCSLIVETRYDNEKFSLVEMRCGGGNAVLILNMRYDCGYEVIY